MYTHTQSMDFLPSYFQAGMRLMVQQKLNTWNLAYVIFVSFGSVVLQAMVFFSFFTILLFPMVWATEMNAMSNNTALPIFISRTEIDSEKMRLEKEWVEQGNDVVLSHDTNQSVVLSHDTNRIALDKEAHMKKSRQSFIEKQSLLNAFQWTVYVIAGSSVAYPKADLARCVRSIGVGLNQLLIIILTAAAATILTTNAIMAQSTTINQFNELANKKVCAEMNSVPYKFLKSQTATQLNVIEDISNNNEMFWLYEQFEKDKPGALNGRTCQAIVYD